MEFKIKKISDHKKSPASPLSIVLPQDIKSEIQAIKRSNEQNRRLVAHMTREFFAQIVDKYHAGEFDGVHIEENDMRKLLGC